MVHFKAEFKTGEDVKKKLRFLREERLSPHEVKPDGFVDHFFCKKKKKMVGVRGFEPPASASRTQRSSQTEPHPDLCRKLELSFKFVYIIYHGFLRLQAFFRKKDKIF